MKVIANYFLIFFVICVSFAIFLLYPYNTEKTEKYDGLTITEFRRHYPFDIEDAGLGKYLDQKVCIDSANFCARAEDVFYSYPKKNPGSPWMDFCDPETNKQRYFNRFSGVELKC
jgi:hypothetical protein